MSSIIGPFEVSIFVHVVKESDCARQFAKVEVSIPKGNIPTIESIHNGIGQALEGIPEGFRLLDGQEFFSQLVFEKYGHRVRVAGGDGWDYDVDALTSAALAERAKRKQTEEDSEVMRSDDGEWDEDMDEDDID